VRRLLESEEGRGTAVVVNEFGEVGLDDALLASSAAAGSVALLGNGCVCCQKRGGLEQTIRHLLAERARGAAPPFARIVLETSGADDPVPILQALMSERGLARECHLRGVVAVLDARTAAASLVASPEARAQLAIADRVVVNRADIAPEGAIEPLLARLAALAPGAPVEVARHGDVPAGFLLADSALPAPGLLRAHQVAHTDGLASFALAFDSPLPWRGVAAAVGLLQELRGADLLRVKGLLAIEGCAGPVLVQAVRQTLHRPLELETWPEGRSAGRLVFITQNGLDRARVEAAFAAVLALLP
jgi:G3E family GTPase